MQSRTARVLRRLRAPTAALAGDVVSPVRTSQRAAEAVLPLFLRRWRVVGASAQKLCESCRGREQVRLLDWNGRRRRGGGTRGGIGLELNRRARRCPVGDPAQPLNAVAQVGISAQ